MFIEYLLGACLEILLQLRLLVEGRGWTGIAIVWVFGRSGQVFGWSQHQPECYGGSKSTSIKILLACSSPRSHQLTRITGQPRSHQLQQLCPDHTGLEAPYLGVWNMGGHKYTCKLHYEHFWIKHLFIFCLQKVSWFLFLFCWRECLCLALVWNMGGQLGTNMLPIECN